MLKSPVSQVRHSAPRARLAHRAAACVRATRDSTPGLTSIQHFVDVLSVARCIRPPSLPTLTRTRATSLPTAKMNVSCKKGGLRTTRCGVFLVITVKATC